MKSPEEGGNLPVLVGGDIKFAIKVLKASAEHNAKDAPKKEIIHHHLHLRKEKPEPLHWTMHPQKLPEITESTTRELGLASAEGLQLALEKAVSGDFKLEREQAGLERAIVMLTKLSIEIERLRITQEEPISDSKVEEPRRRSWRRLGRFAIPGFS